MSQNTGKQNQQQGKPKGGQMPFKGYIRCEIGKAEAAEYKEWSAAQSDTQVLEQLTRCVDSGYRVGISAKEESFMCSLSNSDGPAATVGWVLTAFGRDPISAITALLFKHYVKLGEDWGNGDNPDDWVVR